MHQTLGCKTHGYGCCAIGKWSHDVTLHWPDIAALRASHRSCLQSPRRQARESSDQHMHCCSTTVTALQTPTCLRSPAVAKAQARPVNCRAEALWHSWPQPKGKPHEAHISNASILGKTAPKLRKGTPLPPRRPSSARPAHEGAWQQQEQNLQSKYRASNRSGLGMGVCFTCMSGFCTVPSWKVPSCGCLRALKQPHLEARVPETIERKPRVLRKARAVGLFARI